MPLLEQIQKDMVAAMKAKDELRLSVVRMIKTALKKHEVDAMKPLDEATEMQVLNTLLKQRRESVDMFRKGGREELAQKEEAELKMIEAYLPSTQRPRACQAILNRFLALVSCCWRSTFSGLPVRDCRPPFLTMTCRTSIGLGCDPSPA